MKKMFLVLFVTSLLLASCKFPIGGGGSTADGTVVPIDTPIIVPSPAPTGFHYVITTKLGFQHECEVIERAELAKMVHCRSGSSITTFKDEDIREIGIRYDE